MARYKIIDRSPRFLPVVLDAQLMSGSFEYALDYLIDHQLDLGALDRRYCNDDTGSTAYDPRVLLKIILLAYSRGMISSRSIERACRENVLFMTISGDCAPQFTTLAKFVRELRSEITELFTQVLLSCDAQGLIGRQMFAIDGVKLPSNAAKKRSGTHAELARQAERMEAAVATILTTHQSRDETTTTPSRKLVSVLRGRRCTPAEVIAPPMAARIISFKGVNAVVGRATCVNAAYGIPRERAHAKWRSSRNSKLRRCPTPSA